MWYGGIRTGAAMTGHLNYDLLLIRTDILGLIKRVAMAARQTRSGDVYWALSPILKQLTYIYRVNGGKLNADSNKKMHL